MNKNCQIINQRKTNASPPFMPTYLLPQPLPSPPAQINFAQSSVDRQYVVGDSVKYKVSYNNEGERQQTLLDGFCSALSADGDKL